MPDLLQERVPSRVIQFRVSQVNVFSLTTLPHPLHLDADLRAAIVRVFLRLLDKLAAPARLKKVERHATLVFQAADRTIAVALSVRLQVRLVRESLLRAPLNHRLAIVVADRSAARH